MLLLSNKISSSQAFVFLGGARSAGWKRRGLAGTLATTTPRTTTTTTWTTTPRDHCNSHTSPWNRYMTTTTSSSFPTDNTTGSTTSTTGSIIPPELFLLQQQLESLGLSPQDIHQATLQSIHSPMQGFDPRFGKSAIKTYRSYWKQHKSSTTTPASTSTDEQQQQQQQQQQPYKENVAQALRTAHQIQFLIQRHLAHTTEWIRHDDRAENAKGAAPPTVVNNDNPHPYLILVLDNLRSAMNVGSLFRSADATGCAAIYTCGRTPHPFGNGHDKVVKTSLGAEQLVATQHFGTTQEALESLKTTVEGIQILGLETTEQSLDYVQLDYTTGRATTTAATNITTTTGSRNEQEQQKQKQQPQARWALVLGNEVTGVDPSLASYMDHWIEIPMMGHKNSLNVAVCAPIVLYEIWRQHRRP